MVGFGIQGWAPEAFEGSVERALQLSDAALWQFREQLLSRSRCQCPETFEHRVIARAPGGGAVAAVPVNDISSGADVLLIERRADNRAESVDRSGCGDAITAVSDYREAVGGKPDVVSRYPVALALTQYRNA